MSTSAADSRPTSLIGPRQGRSRAQSISSDRPSTISYGLLSPPGAVSPEAAFIAATAASQIVTNDHDNHARTWYDQNGVEPAEEVPVVSSGALKLLNSFLDQLLFNFLQVAKSTSLATLRPAVSDILKPKLARDTIHNADEELREYLGGVDEDDYEDPQSTNVRDWDVELVWKRTRLRCMVYSSLGDLEEDDEDRYMQQENLEVGADETSADSISPAVAIFLTSVLEYMGELTLTVAGQAAYSRIRGNIEKGLKDGTRNPSDRAEPIVVGDLDMERVALDRTLGRLWRGWKKRIRSPAVDPVGQSLPPNSPIRNSLASHLQDQRSTASDGGNDSKKVQDHMENMIEEDVDPADMPLPMGKNDVEEIEVPGLARNSDDEEEEEEEEEFPTRRVQSFIVARPTAITDLRIATLPISYDDAMLGLHKRSLSMPIPRRSLLYATARPRSKVLEAKEVAASSAQEAVPVAKGPSDADDLEGVDDTAFEKAEILTSSRVSVASTSSRSVSDSSRPMPLKRSSSVHSARIIDVPAPRSPVSSRASSLDTHERPRPSSLTGPSSLTQSISFEESRNPKPVDTVSRVGAVVSVGRSPVDRMRPSLQNAATISESEEEIDDRSGKGIAVDYHLPSARTRDQLGRLPHSIQTNIRQVEKPSASPKVGQAQSGPKTVITTSGGHPVEEMAENGRRNNVHASRQGSTAEGKGFPAPELTRSKDTEEEVVSTSHSGVPPRPIHTSGSSNSSGTGLLKAVRTSEDTSSRAENMARNFEQLIQSNQTITYTLTPENMRDINVKTPHDSPVVTRVTRKSEEARGSSADVGGSPSTQRTLPALPQVPVEAKPKPSGPVPRAPAGVAISMGRIGGPQAREARVASESLADFAEFIKSTGPPGDKGPASLRSVQVPTSPTKRSIDSRRVSVTSNTSYSRNRYQTREATVDSTADNSELIDFIRQGPTTASNTQHQHRIPRHVAPFRNTMDSDMMVGAVGGKAIDAVIPEIRYSQASTSFTEVSMPSMQSSVNSNSALLKNKGSSKASKLFGEDDGMPVRKTRRVRDPYAIDFSDEEGDDFEELPRPPVKKEESLAEFLRNYEPPPEPVSPPSRKPKKKASAPSLIGRFTRKDSIREANSHVEARSLNSRTSNTPFSGNESGTTLTRTSSKHIPLQVNMPPGYDRYGLITSQPTTSASTGSVGRPTPAPMGRVPMKRFEPREPVSSSQTSDLAAFLRNSEPPPEIPPPQAQIRAEEVTGFSRLFGRRKTPVV